MSLLPHSSSSEEPENQPTIHSTETTPTQPAPISDSPVEAAESQLAPTASEDIPTLPTTSSKVPAEETEQVPTVPVVERIEDTEHTVIASSEPGETAIQHENAVSNAEETLNTEEIFDEEPATSDFSEPARSGVFIHKGFLIAAACIVAAVLILVAVLVFVNNPKDPPTDWLASTNPASTTTSPNRTTSTQKILYYLHWTNQNGDLKGQMQLAANTNGTPQSLTAPTIGLYNKNSHNIYVVITINGQPTTLTGKINDANDTLTLNQVNAPDQSDQLVFHMSNASEFKTATGKLNSPKK